MSDITPNIPNSLKEKEEEKTKRRVYDYIQESNEVINIVSEILEEIIGEYSKNEINDDEEINEESTLMKSFISKKVPQITIKNYLKRIMKYSKPEPSTVIISLIYIDKVCENSNLRLTQFNIHR
jgi:hypothetical protein